MTPSGWELGVYTLVTFDKYCNFSKSSGRKIRQKYFASAFDKCHNIIPNDDHDDVYFFLLSFNA